MQSTESTTSAGAVAPRPPMHPLLKVAAVSVIAASAVGIWAMTARTHSNADAANAPANTLAAVPPVAATDTAAPAAAPARSHPSLGISCLPSRNRNPTVASPPRNCRHSDRESAASCAFVERCSST